MVWRGGMSFHGGLNRGDGRDVVVRALARTRILRGCGFHRAPGAPRPRGRTPRELHQRTAVGNAVGSSLGDGVSRPSCRDAPRHPSQLYEALLEGVVLFAVLWWFTRRPRPAMAASGVFLIGYGLARDPRRVRPGPRCPSRVPRLRLGDDGTGADPADDRGGHGSGGHGGGPARTGRAGETAGEAEPSGSARRYPSFLTGPCGGKNRNGWLGD